MFNSPFDIRKERELDPETEVVFVSDLFVDEYVGGAELTSQSLIDACPLKIECLKSKDVTLALLESGHQKYWIFGNY